MAIHETVVSEEAISSPRTESAGIDPFPQASSVSEGSKRYMAYKSPLASFASITPPVPADSLSSSSLQPFSSLLQPSALSSLSSTVSLLPSMPIIQRLPDLLRPLKEKALRKLDPNKSICQFEIPGAGKCRDPTCVNIHLRAFEPSDDETARYLAETLPAPQPTVQEIKATLARTRASKQDLDLDSCIFQTLLQLGIR